MLTQGAVLAKPSIVPLITSLSNAGLTTNLQTCLDAGDSASYSSGQSWLDRSGNGQDFFRGSGSGSDASDPTFNGSAGGLSSGEYFSFDGGDYLTYDSANETWMQNIHKNNALFTLAISFYLGSLSATQYLMATGNNSASIGFEMDISTGGALALYILNGSGTVLHPSSLTISANQWNHYILSIDEAAGGTASHHSINGSITAFDGTYASPSASSASGTLKLGGRPAASSSLVSGSRIGMLAGWSRALSQSETGQLYNFMHARYP